MAFEPEATFTEFDGDPIIFPATGVQGLAIADYNGDGLDDIAYGDSGTGSIGFIYNLGDRQFEAGTPIAVANPNDVPVDLTQSYGPNLRDVVPIDINGDGLTDLAYGTQLQQRLDYLVNEGGGTFRPESGYAFTELVRDLEKADYDNDGFEEIAVAAANRGGFGDRSRIYIDYVGPTGRTLVQSLRDFRPDGQVNQIVAGDIDNDGFVDIGLRMNFRFRYMFNDGDRTFTNADPRQNCDSSHVLGDYSDIADFNEDGLLDVVISELPVSRFCRNERPRLDVYINRGGRTFDGRKNIDRFSGTETSGFVFALDTDGDRHLDIVMSQGDSVNVYRGLGDGSFLPVETGALDYNLDFLAPYDIDDNGALDLVSAQRFSVTIQFSKDPDGGALIAGPGEFSTLEKQPDGTWIRRYKDGNIVEFNADGRQTAEVDTRGNRREFAYDGDGRLTTVTDQTGGQMTLSYTADGQLQRIVYPDGRETLFDITPEGAFAGVTEPDGGEIRYRYDEEGRLVAVTDQRGNTTEHSYTSAGSYSGSLFPNGASIANATGATLGLDDLDAPQPLAYVAPEDRVSTHTDEKGGVTRIVVNEFGAIVETTDPIGRVTRFTRNADNLVTRVERPTDNPADGAGTLVRVDEMTYDTRGNMTSLTMAVGTTLERTRRYEYEPVFSNVTKFTDFDGFETTYEYDTFGDLIRMVDAEGNVSTYEYNIAGLISRSVDERGQVMSYNYDTRLNMVDMIHPDLSFDRNIYDDRGNVIERIEAFGRPEQRSLLLEYDIEDRVISQEMTDSTGASIDGKAFFEYDIAGNMVATVDETGLRTEYVFDNMNQQIAETSPAYGETTYAYNGSSEMTSETDAEGITRTWEYDIVGRMTRTVDGVGNVSTFEYDVSDNLERVTDGRGNVTNFGFDILERRISRTNPINQTIQMAYDLRDNLIQVTRENGELETATYDGLSRRLSVTTVDNTLSYSYDEEGNLLTAADDDSALSMTYDLRDRLASVTTDGTVGPQPAVTLSYTYDALNQRTSLTDSLGGIWSYGFDEKSRVASITAPWGDTHSMEYDPAGRRTELVNTTGRQTLAGYASDRLSQLEHFQNAVPIARSGFAYAEDGAVSLLRNIDDATQSRSLAYDGINRLLQVAEGVPAADGGVPIPVEDYAYDENGNRTASHISNSYVVDDHNRLLQDDTYSYGYDEKGNRVTRTRTSDGRVETFTYNSVNQLIAVTSTDGLDAAYAYDALGRRIAKTVNGEVTSYVYDIGNFYDITGHDRLLDFQNGALTNRWLHGQQIDEPVGYESYGADSTAGAGTAYALHADRQGSVIAVTEQSTDTVVARYVYDAFGQREQTVSTVLQDYGFTGREFDPETGLYYYRARHYDPGQGRFIQSDPLGFAAGDLNLYAYTWNDPANWSDPSGLSASGDAGRTSAGAAALARQNARRVGRGARCAASKVSSFLSGIGRELMRGGDLSQLKVQNLKCRVRVKAPKCGCNRGGLAGAAAGAAAGYAAGGGFSSFPAGTEVLTPNGRVAIENLREGDLVIARDEDNGVSGVFPVTALMSRTAAEVIWLTLENAEGKTTRMGVTSEHPLFLIDQGWTNAEEVVVGDLIRDADLLPLTVLAVEVDDTPTRVHNLEIAEAHTYFAGELQAWGHNASKKAPEVLCAIVSPDDALNFMMNALGPNPSDLGGGRYQSADGRTQVRFGKHETQNPRNLHCHIEDIKDGKVTFSRTFKIK